MGTVKKEALEQPTKKSGSSGYVNIAQSLIDQMSKAGQPRTTTTTLTQPEEPLNFMNLGIMAMMILEEMLNKKKTVPANADFSSLLTSATPGVGAGASLNSGIMPTPIPAPNSGMPGNLASLDPMQLLQMLMKAQR